MLSHTIALLLGSTSHPKQNPNIFPTLVEQTLCPPLTSSLHSSSHTGLLLSRQKSRIHSCLRRWPPFYYNLIPYKAVPWHSSGFLPQASLLKMPSRISLHKIALHLFPTMQVNCLVPSLKSSKI